MSDSPCFSPDARLEDLIAAASRKYKLAFEPISAGGVTLQVAQIANMREILDKVIDGKMLDNPLEVLPLWAKIWPASMVLGHMLRHIPPAGQRFLEIGAGCGVTGLVAAALGFEKVCITDINEDALLFARINILKNGLQDRAEVRRVDLRTDTLEDRFTLIAGAEILYLEDLHAPLLDFLNRHLAPKTGSPAPQILLATDQRRASTPFLKPANDFFQIGHKQIGAQSTEKPGECAERHRIDLHRLSPR